jgi:quinohemoprotein ethanol dehydrogenase
MAFSPDTGLVYIPAIELSAVFDDHGIVTKDWRRGSDNILDVGANAAFPLDEKGDSALVAWNPATQTQQWRVKTPGYWNGGVMATAGGLVFQGHIDGTFNAYAAETGRLVWKFDAQSPVLAPPISYALDGRQYITVLTGMGTSGSYLGPLLERFNLNPATQSRRVLTFVLNGKAVLPPRSHEPVHISADADFEPRPDSQRRGLVLYAQRCGVCHGFRAAAVGAAPDLRGSAVPRSSETFSAVLKRGTLVSGGMPQFDELSDGEIEDIRQYLRFEAVTAPQKNLQQ